MNKKQADNKSVGNFFNNKVDAKIGSSGSSGGYRY